MTAEVIYVLQAGSLPYFKIGLSKNVMSRVKELQTGLGRRKKE